MVVVAVVYLQELMLHQPSSVLLHRAGSTVGVAGVVVVVVVVVAVVVAVVVVVVVVVPLVTLGRVIVAVVV